MGRNENENHLLIQAKNGSDYFFEVPECGSPTSILQGPKTKKAIQKAASITAFHSDRKHEQTAKVSYGKDRLDKKITISLPSMAEIDTLRI